MKYISPFFLVVAIWLGFPSESLSRVVVERPLSLRKVAVVKVVGKILPEEDVIFKEELEKIEKHGYKVKLNAVVLDTAGGNGAAAREMGKLIRAKKMNTYVAPDAQCGSACIYVLTGGLVRMAFGAVSVHRTSYTDELPTEKLEKALTLADKETRKHMEEMGLSILLTDAILMTPHWASRLLDETEKRRWGVNATDRYYEEIRFRSIAALHKMSVDDVNDFFRDNYAECEKRARNFEMTVWDCVQNSIK